MVGGWSAAYYRARARQCRRLADPDGPFHNDFIWNEQSSEWRWHMTQQNAKGEWSEFGDVRLTRAQ